MRVETNARFLPTLSPFQDGYEHNFFKTLNASLSGDPGSPLPPKCENVGSDQWNNCWTGFFSETFGLPYDYESIMHYAKST